MTLSAFDIIGPPMIGPSSSHTAGAVRIGRVARALCEQAVAQAVIALHGSFAATGKGHATDRALVAGLLGFAPDDTRLKDSLTLASEQNVGITFSEIDLGEDAHPNSVRITVSASNGESHELEGSSVGGGTIAIGMIDRYPTSFGGGLETLLLWHHDKSGFLAKVTTLLACVEANIATIRTSRQARGSDALTLIEVDAPLPSDCLSLLKKIPATLRLRTLPRLA